MVTFANFMLRPFLAIYLYDKLDNNLLVAAMVVGLQPATSMVAGLYGGSLADRFGRKPLMVASLAIEAVTMIGFAFADSLLHFAVLTIINGVGASLFWPAASAQVSDVVPEEQRGEVFALLHTAVNVGAAMGPLIGVKVYQMNPAIAFFTCSLMMGLYCLLIIWKVPETLPKKDRTSSAVLQQTDGDDGENQAFSKQPKMVLREHKLLLAMTLLALPVSFLYSQVEIVLPQHLKTQYVDYLNVFAMLMTVNGIFVVCTQMLIAKYAEKFPAQRVILAAYLLLACVGVGYGWAPTFALLIVAEIFFTLGEMLYGPQIQKAVSVIAPEEYRGRYFSIFGSNWQLTGTFGPSLGALMFGVLGGGVWFSIVGAALLIAGFFQYGLVKKAMAYAEKCQSVTEEKLTDKQVVI